MDMDVVFYVVGGIGLFISCTAAIAFFIALMRETLVIKLILFWLIISLVGVDLKIIFLLLGISSPGLNPIDLLWGIPLLITVQEISRLYFEKREEEMKQEKRTKQKSINK